MTLILMKEKGRVAEAEQIARERNEQLGRLNDELKAKGFVTIAGRINRQYFNERVYGLGKEDCNNVSV